METSVAGTSSSSSSITYSLFELIQIIYLEGINSITGWENMLCSLKKVILEEPEPLVNIFFILSNAVTNFLMDEVSQATYLKIKDSKISFEALMHYFNEQINEDHLNMKSINFDYIKRFKELIKKSENKIEKIDCINIIDSETDINDDDDDDDDIIEKAFSSVFSPKKKSNIKTNNTKFEQSFHLLTNDEKKWIKTPGEEGRYLIEIKITDTKDIKKVPTDEWWKKVGKKAVFLTSSSQDPLYIESNKILKEAINKINKIKNISKGKYTVGNKFKPY